MRRLGEIELIQRFFAPLAQTAASLGLQDDAAFLSPQAAAQGLVITADAVVAGVHFFEADSPGDVAYKALAVNVSDLAAKAARPVAYTLCLALADAPTEDWAKAFAEGLERAQTEFGIHLIGGDTVTAKGAWWASITAFGEASAKGLVPRGGAKAGDYIFLSGTLGDAALGLKLRLDEKGLGEALDEAAREHLLERYLHPRPKLGLRAALEQCAHASMDVSDGLVLDLGRMCRASGCSAEINVELLPLSEAAQMVLAINPAALETILTGGDDYEILAAVPADKAAQFHSLADEADVPVTMIGYMSDHEQAAVRFVDAAGAPLSIAAGGFEHFAK